MAHSIHLLKVGSCLALTVTMTLTMTACQTVNGLSKKQVSVLQSQGFVQGSDGWTLGLSEKLLFGSDEFTIKPDTYHKIVAIGQQLHQVDINHLLLNGYTDNTGTAIYNQDLSLKRANAVAEPLIEGGIPASDVKTRGLGEDHPIADNSTEDGRNQNRRVAIIVTP